MGALDFPIQVSTILSVSGYMEDPRNNKYGDYARPIIYLSWLDETTKVFFDQTDQNGLIMYTSAMVLAI